MENTEVKNQKTSKVTVKKYQTTPEQTDPVVHERKHESSYVCHGQPHILHELQTRRLLFGWPQQLLQRRVPRDHRTRTREVPTAGGNDARHD